MIATIPSVGGMMMSLMGVEACASDVVSAGLIAALLAVLVHFLGKLMKISGQHTNATLDKIEEYFPGAITNEALVVTIKESLEGFDFGETSLLATSLCCDEVNRSLEKDLAGIYGQYYSMGGLAGVPFGGVTAFGVMASHIPDGGSCLVVYGPHVGVDAYGNIGTVSRRGRANGGSCCLSAVTAAAYVKDVVEKGTKPDGVPTEAFDAQQFFVGNMLLPYGKRLQQVAQPMAELPYALYDAQTELMEKIVAKGCGHVKGDGVIALLGGIQINTPVGMSDYFLPLRFDILNSRGEIIEKISKAPSRATVSKIMCTFPKALSNAALVDKVKRMLAPYGYSKSTLLCTSLCSDELNRRLETDLQTAFGDNYRIGGLSGFAFGGATGFRLMAGHIPDGGSCLVVYGPHVGVDSTGKIGTVDRRGCEFGGTCCGSGIAAAAYVEQVMNGGPKADGPTDPMDAQQAYVCEMLLPYGRQLQMAADPMVELPYALFHAQDKMMKRIVSRGCGRVAGWGKIALLGGIQINTPEGVSDYFLPLRFEVLKNNGEDVDDLLLRQQ